MTLDSSYIGYLGFLSIDLFKSVLMYSNGAICLIKLLFKIGLFTVYMTQKIRQIWYSCTGRRPRNKKTKGAAENQRNA